MTAKPHKKPAKKTTTKKKSGRPSKIDSFTPQDYKMVVKLAKLGMTDTQMSEFFEVSEVTLNSWKKKDPLFLKSLKNGKRVSDENVKVSLYHRAVGYSHPEEKTFCNNGEIVTHETIKHYPPDPTSMIFWLKNRQPGKWRDKQHVEVDVLTLEDKLKQIREVQSDQKLLPEPEGI